MARRNRVVVTAMGVLAANGIGLEDFWSSIVHARSGIAPITSFDTEGLPSRIAGEVKNFDPKQYIDPALKPDRRLGRASQLGMAAAKLAFDEILAKSNPFPGAGEIPVVTGASGSSLELRERKPASWIAVQSIPHIVCSGIAYSLGLNARLLTISTGCGSGMDAVAIAADEIRSGKAEIAIAAAADSVMSRYVFECFARSRKLSTRNDEPKKASRPFDRNRCGGVVAEGSGVIVLENREYARARGIVPYAEILGYGSSADRPGTEEGTGMASAMRMALANSSLRTEQIDHINAHGPSDQHMDLIETRMIKDVFGQSAYRIPVTSIKGVTGNPMGVGCMHQIIASALSLHEGTIPPTANWEDPDPDCDLDYVPHKARRQAIETVLVNTHGFGRGNSTLILCKGEK